MNKELIENELDEYCCDICRNMFTAYDIVGNCADPECDIICGNMCSNCGIWDEKKGDWFCPEHITKKSKKSKKSKK